MGKGSMRHDEEAESSHCSPRFSTSSRDDLNQGTREARQLDCRGQQLKHVSVEFAACPLLAVGASIG